jgi:hypothetical protein
MLTALHGNIVYLRFLSRCMLRYIISISCTGMGVAFLEFLSSYYHHDSCIYNNTSRANDTSFLHHLFMSGDTERNLENLRRLRSETVIQARPINQRASRWIRGGNVHYVQLDTLFVVIIVMDEPRVVLEDARASFGSLTGFCIQPPPLSHL